MLIHPFPPAGTKLTSKTKVYSIPASDHPELRGHPIISFSPSAWSTYADGRPNQGHGRSFTGRKAYDQAVAHILAYFSDPLRPRVSGICMNCFLFHEGTACASLEYDWNSMIDRDVHPTCRHCNLQHHWGPCPTMRDTSS